MSGLYLRDPTIFVETHYLIGCACLNELIDQMEDRLFAKVMPSYEAAYYHLKHAAGKGHQRSQFIMTVLAQYFSIPRRMPANLEKDRKEIVVGLRTALAA